MENNDNKKIFENKQHYDNITNDDYVNNCCIPNINLDDCPHICVFGKSWCGKSNFICCLLLHHFIHKIEYQNIIIFSPTFDTDVSYQPIWWYLKEQYDKHNNNNYNWFKQIDIDKINNIVNKQNELKDVNE